MTRSSRAATAVELVELGEHVDVEQFQLVRLVGVGQEFGQAGDCQRAVDRLQLCQGLGRVVAAADDGTAPDLETLAPFLLFNHLPLVAGLQSPLLGPAASPLCNARSPDS